MEWNWIFDLSLYQNLTDDQWKTAIDHGLSGVIIKASQNLGKDPLLDTHVKMAEKYSVPYGFYHWADPIGDFRKQADFFLNLASKYKPKSLWLDEEQYWMDWNEYWNVLTKKGTYLRKFSPETLYAFYYNISTEFKKQSVRFFPQGIQLGSYGAAWFVNGYCPKLATVINQVLPNYWNMSFRNWLAGDYDNDKVMDWKELPLFLQSITPVTTDLPRGVYNYNIWQVGEIPIEGFPKLDFNVLTPAACKMLFGDQPPQIPDPETPPVVNPSDNVLQYKVTADPFLNGRSSPNVTSTDIADIPHGTVLSVLDISGSDAWIEYEPGKWACVKKGAKSFMEKA